MRCRGGAPPPTPGIRDLPPRTQLLALVVGLLAPLVTAVAARITAPSAEASQQLSVVTARVDTVSKRLDSATVAEASDDREAHAWRAGVDRKLDRIACALDKGLYDTCDGERAMRTVARGAP